MSLMKYQNTPEFALMLDEQDPLGHLRKEFLIPQHNGRDAIYLCGNSLGLQPVGVHELLSRQLAAWQNLGVEGWFEGNEAWLGYHRKLSAQLAGILGAAADEVTVMNSLTVNLHLLLVSFYKPTNKKYKIVMEAGAFPSDQYAVESQVKFHGYEPKDAIIEVFPREGEVVLRVEDIIKKIQTYAGEVALVLFSGINYYTGQFYNIEAITKATHEAGAYAGFDLAHAAGNVPLQLHNWGCDFAVWCSYKYLNSGPGGIGGAFVHQKHFENKDLMRLAGWWGYRADKRFLMEPGFEAAYGAEGWQVSTSPILLLAAHKAALDVFEQAGGLTPLRNKSELLTGYLEFLINDINRQLGEEFFRIITPKNITGRGCQLSVICRSNGRAIFNFLKDNGFVGDWREPDVIRFSPAPLYNKFKEVFDTCAHLLNFVSAGGF